MGLCYNYYITKSATPNSPFTVLKEQYLTRQNWPLTPLLMPARLQKVPYALALRASFDHGGVF